MFGRKNNRQNIANTIVAIDTSITGDLHFKGGCHVDGIIHGNVSADPDSQASLSLAEGGTIDGGVTVPYVLLEGIVKGDVFANQRVVLGKTARVVGNPARRPVARVAAQSGIIRRNLPARCALRGMRWLVSYRNLAAPRLPTSTGSRRSRKRSSAKSNSAIRWP